MRWVAALILLFCLTSALAPWAAFYVVETVHPNWSADAVGMASFTYSILVSLPVTALFLIFTRGRSLRFSLTTVFVSILLVVLSRQFL